MAKNTYYFPHDYHARHDPKLERLRMEIGAAGDGIFWCLVEMLYEQDGYLLLKDIPLIAKALNTPEELVAKVVKDTELFIVNEQKFYSESLLARLQHINTKRRKARASAKLSHPANAQRTHSERSAIKESKVKESKGNKKKGKEKEIPPPLEAVSAYCQERNKGVDPNKWYNHYQAKGWMIGKNKMKDWKAAVRTWEKEYKNPAEVYFKGKELK